MRCFFTILLFFNIMSLSAVALPQDSIMHDAVAPDSVQQADTVSERKLNIIEKVLKYFDDSNKPPSDKKIDFSLIGGPGYSNDTKLSLGLLGAALYTMGDSTLNTTQSNASLYTVFSVTGYYNVGIRGNHFTPGDKWRFNYKLSFYSMPTYFWGIGYDMERNDDNKTKYLHLNAEVKSSFDYRLSPNCYVGPTLHFNYTKAADADSYVLWEGQRHGILNYGVGLNLYYDSRDLVTAPSRGWHIGFEQRFYPRFLFNKNPFSSTDIFAAHYFGAWRGSIFAVRLHGIFTYGDTPWTMLPWVGGRYIMRGYYEGRYRDKNVIDATVELRQHVWRRNGIAVWLGAASVFDKFKELQTRKILPNFGVGYRWEFKKGVNVRLDFGVGKGETGVVINVNEAF